MQAVYDHPDARGYLASADGSRPFYYVADTHWPLLWHYTLAEALEIAANRRRIGFTAIQISVVPFNDVANCHGDHIFGEDESSRAALEPNERYFAHVDAVLDGLESMGFAVYTVLLWWNQVDSVIRASGVSVCRQYGLWLGARWRSRHNLLFVLGGDERWRSADAKHFRALAEGLRDAQAQQLISFHPIAEHSSSEYFGNAEDDPWLGFSTLQLHRSAEDIAQKTAADVLNGQRPSVVAETRYFWRTPCTEVFGWRFCIHADASRVRASHWSARLGGGSFGEGYGSWPFWTGHAAPSEWRPALSNQPSAFHIGYVMQSILCEYPWHMLRPATSETVVRRHDGAGYIPAGHTGDGNALLAYWAEGVDGPLSIDLAWFANASGHVRSIWYDPTSGDKVSVRIMNADGWQRFDPSSVRAASVLAAEELTDVVLGLAAYNGPPPSPPHSISLSPPLLVPTHSSSPRLLPPPCPPQAPLPPWLPAPSEHPHRPDNNISAALVQLLLVCFALIAAGSGALSCRWVRLRWQRRELEGLGRAATSMSTAGADEVAPRSEATTALRRERRAGEPSTILELDQAKTTAQCCIARQARMRNKNKMKSKKGYTQSLGAPPSAGAAECGEH